MTIEEIQKQIEIEKAKLEELEKLKTKVAEERARFFALKQENDEKEDLLEKWAKLLNNGNK